MNAHCLQHPFSCINNVYACIAHSTHSCLLLQPGKLVAERDASADVLARLEDAAAESLGPGSWDSKARKKAAAAKAAARPAAGVAGSSAGAGGYAR
jgi:hypothetical protein